MSTISLASISQTFLFHFIIFTNALQGVKLISRFSVDFIFFFRLYTPIPCLEIEDN